MESKGEALPIAPGNPEAEADHVKRWFVYRLEFPCGRVIGDQSCRYDHFAVVMIELKTDAGRSGWGFFEVPAHGTFSQEAWYLVELPDEDSLAATLDRTYSDALRGREADSALRLLNGRKCGLPQVDNAVRLALWDLAAQVRGVSLAHLLGGPNARDRVRAYGSLLDFALGEQEAVGLARRFVAEGFDPIKVKVGSQDVMRDVKRLHAVRDAIGPDVGIAIDANEAWTYEVAIERLCLFEREGIEIAYLEDPLPHADVEGLARLVRDTGVPIAAHDYIVDVEALHVLVESGATSIVRIYPEISFAARAAALAEKRGLRASVENWLFEVGCHVASAYPVVERVEYSGHLTDRYVEQPIAFEGGCAIVPTRPGHGIVPKAALLEDYRRPRTRERM